MTTDTNPTGIKETNQSNRGIDYPNEWRLVRITEPDIEPVTTAEAKTHMRVEISDDDTYIGTLITAAREWVEDYTGRALIDQTWQLKFQGYSYAMEFFLRRSPVIAVQSFVYDEAGVATTLATTKYELTGERTKWPKIIPTYGQSWPGVNWARPLTIQFRAGYADRSASPTEGADKVPAAYKHAIKLLVAHYYENRELVNVGNLTELPMGVEFLLRPHRCELSIA